MTRAPNAAGRIFAVFGAAWTTLRRRAEAEAQETVRDALNVVRAADKEITRIAVTLEPRDRARIASARGGLGKRIEALAKRLARWNVVSQLEKRRGRDEGRTGEKDRP